MELQEFITESLTQILTGVKAAEERAGEHGGVINPRVRSPGGDKRPVIVSGTGLRPAETVHFDVAVTVVEGTQAKAGIGVVAGVFGIGAKGSSTAESSSISRLKFSVPIAFPFMDPQENPPDDDLAVI
ncbi:MAG: hypothetical protein V3T84_14560 [Phycisphaerales bacterium]